MYPMSKNKASFRIADILHQQQTDSQLLAHHLMLKNGHQIHSTDFKNDTKTRSNETKQQSNDLSNSPSPDTSSLTEPASPNHQINNNTVGGGKNDFPMKPTPMYSNFQLPFPLGIHPAFHPAAYLNYADAIHKGESSVSWWTSHCECEEVEFRIYHLSELSYERHQTRLSVFTHVTN
jgi:hypothetical protein